MQVASRIPGSSQIAYFYIGLQASQILPSAQADVHARSCIKRRGPRRFTIELGLGSNNTALGMSSPYGPYLAWLNRTGRARDLESLQQECLGPSAPEKWPLFYDAFNGQHTCAILCAVTKEHLHNNEEVDEGTREALAK